MQKLGTGEQAETQAKLGGDLRVEGIEPLTVGEVHDRGIGIPHTELDRIGRRFFRASNAKAITGTGLGLYSARRLLAYHGGTLTLDSNDRGGTTAVVRVPLSLAQSGKAMPQEITV